MCIRDRHEVDDRDDGEGDGPAQVQGLAQLGGVQDGRRVTEVGLDVRGPALGGAGQQALGEGEHDRVVVDVDDPGLGGHRLGDLVQVRRGRDAGADVQELAHARLLGEPAHGTVHEVAVGPHVHRERGPLPGHGVARLLVGGVVVLAAEYVVVDAGGVGVLGVDPVGRPSVVGQRRVSHSVGGARGFASAGTRAGRAGGGAGHNSLRSVASSVSVFLADAAWALSRSRASR